VGAPWFPPTPELPESHRASGSIELRYEEIAQDGRATVIGLPHALGEVLWRHRLSGHEGMRALWKQGVSPILSRMVIEAYEDPIPVTKPVSVNGGYDITCSHDESGKVDRIYLDIFIDIAGKRGHTMGGGDNADVAVGRVYAEHVFTKPWGKLEERKVRELPGFPVPRVRPSRPLKPTLPEGATLLDEGPVRDPSPIVFGMMHTDSNQHVNSLVYPRLFEEALLRRHNQTNVLARWLEISYRKPCFAGDRVRVELQAFTRDGEVGAMGAFVPEDGGKPYAYVTMGAASRG
jgi:hypothetical protein